MQCWRNLNCPVIVLVAVGVAKMLGFQANLAYIEQLQDLFDFLGTIKSLPPKPEFAGEPSGRRLVGRHGVCLPATKQHLV